MFGKKPYEVLTNEDIEALTENVNKTKGVEWDEYEIQGEKTNFPMWKVVTASQGDSFEDFKQMFDVNKKSVNDSRVDIDESNVGVVKPTHELTSTGTLAYGDENLVEKVNKLMNGDNVVSDHTGAVKPKADFNTSKDQVTETDTSEPKEATVEKASKAPEAKPGVVKPKEEMGTQNVTTPSEKTPKGEGKVGVVKPKEEMGTQNVEKPSEEEPKGEGKVGVVKPKSDFQSQGVTEINFDKFITDGIKAP